MTDKRPSLVEQLLAATERISELERTDAIQAYLSAIIESADDAIVTKDLNGIVTTWNPAAEKIFGYTAEDMVGKPIARLLPPDRPHEEAAILSRLRKGERIDHFETQRVRKDGRVIDISLTISPISNAREEIIGASKIARDITERKRVEAREREALREAETARQEAETANRAKDDFLATVSHELRTPLTAILGWVRMLAAGTLGEADKDRAIQIIERNVMTQAQLVEDLLDISRIISGKLRIEVKPIETPALITAALEIIRPAADAKQIEIRTVMDDAATHISGDFQRLQQVIWNLLSNAAKFTPRGGTIKIEVHRVRSHIEISVADTGTGIRPGFLPLVFNRFTQADSSITRTHGGLGVGLAISKSIVELHGGSISAMSEGEGKGATFTVKLPIAPLRSGVTRPGYSKTGLVKPLELSGLNILVVDDEPDTCDMLRFMLERAGAVVKTATNAQDALQIIDIWEPHVLVSDIGMPDVDGYELIKRVRAGNPRNVKLPAVALTALARIEDRVKCLSAGYHMHVAKPVEPEELLSVVASLATLGK